MPSHISVNGLGLTYKGTVGISGSVTFVTIANDETSTGTTVLLPYVAR